MCTIGHISIRFRTRSLSAIRVIAKQRVQGSENKLLLVLRKQLRRVVIASAASLGFHFNLVTREHALLSNSRQIVIEYLTGNICMRRANLRKSSRKAYVIAPTTRVHEPDACDIET